MLEDIVNDYAKYIKVDVGKELKGVQDLIDSMLTRLEELSSVLQLVKLKNSNCTSSVSDDIKNHKLEIITLAKKINTLEIVIKMLTDNVNILEKQIEKAEFDFGISNESKIKNFLSTFLGKSKESETASYTQRVELSSVLNLFNDTSQ